MATTPEIRPMPRVAKELSASPGFLLARLGLGYKAKVVAGVERAGFELYDYGILALLAEGVRQTQSAIAAAVDLDPSRMVALLDSLEQRGLVERQRDPLDRRRHVVTITPAGKRELTQIRNVVRKLEDEFLAPLSDTRRAQLHELLLDVAAHNDPSCCPFDDTAPSA
jgi:DNA-binding MarR family transcriptional regulator